MAKLTPMLQQYLDIKKEYTSCILFFRLGDFYEMFFEDAVIASRELEIVLTGRDSGNEKIPMCGIPYHAATGYLAKLITKGYKVAICEQVEDPKAVKGIVKREVIRVITPGTIIEEQLLKEKNNNYLAAVAKQAGSWGLAYVDLSTGEFRVTYFAKGEITLLQAELTRIRPAEIIIPQAEAPGIKTIERFLETTLTYQEATYFDCEDSYKRLREHFQVQNLRGFGIEETPAAISAAGAILGYLIDTQKNALRHVRQIVTYLTGEFMPLDTATRRNLELTRTLRGGDLQGSLLWVLDFTVTAMGGRVLRSWIEQPLARKEAIGERQAALTDLTANTEARTALQDKLGGTYDLQRIISKISSGSANARDLLALKKTLMMIPEITEWLHPFTAQRLLFLKNNLNPLTAVAELLEEAIKAEPPVSIKEGGMIKQDFNEELKKFLTASSEGKRWVAELEQREKERTGIKSLKIGYNHVFGYYLEVSKTNLNLIPEDYIRKQTLANGERFINQTLKEYEAIILNAHDKSIALEYQLFNELKDSVLKNIDALQENAAILAELDALLSLGEAAVRYHYVCPEINEAGNLQITEGRHPVVEKMLETGQFVPNETLLNDQESRTQIITGPNMAGKSTYMRQVALIVLMAHIGSFVPAQAATIPLVDRIFTRVGASDDLATGQSTFMVEMNEVAYILNHATSNSLVILDEIGRGTSTFDGLSIAWAVVEFINNTELIGCKTLLATHYHELTELETLLYGVKNYHIAVRHDGEEIIFLRKIKPGMATRSYGIEVAKLAGLPQAITERSREILQKLEQNESHHYQEFQTSSKTQEEQLALFAIENDRVQEKLSLLDLESTTPLQALNYLYEWQQKFCRTTINE